MDDLRQLVLSDSSCPREAHELLCPRQHEAAIGRAAHGHATAALELQHSLVTQLVEGAQHRVGVDAEDSREVPRRREALTGLGFTVGNRPPDLASDLFVERGLVRTTYFELQYGLSLTRTINTSQGTPSPGTSDVSPPNRVVASWSPPPPPSQGAVTEK
jgi:hypothetical protein